MSRPDADEWATAHNKEYKGFKDRNELATVLLPKGAKALGTATQWDKKVVNVVFNKQKVHMCICWDQQLDRVDYHQLPYSSNVWTSGGRPVQTLCTPCRLCRLFKTFKTTENKSLEFRSREVGDVIRPIKPTGIRKEPVQLGEKGGFLNVWKSVHAPKKVCTWCA